MTRRYEFPEPVRDAAWERCGGRCEGCRNEIRTGNGPEYHHRYLPATEPGSNTLDNCQVLCIRPCHKSVTATQTIPQHAKNKRVYKKRINAQPKRRGFRKPPPGYDPWNRRMREE